MRGVLAYAKKHETNPEEGGMKYPIVLKQKR
jgi:hypothetical protein